MTNIRDDEDDFEELEMPCVCDCGRVFELNGGRALKSGSVVCRSCWNSRDEEEERPARYLDE